MIAMRRAPRVGAAVVAITALLASLLALVAPATPAGAVVNGPGRLDPSFAGGVVTRGFTVNGNASSDFARGVAVDGSGNVWAAGTSTASGTTVLSWAKFKPDGSIAQTFTAPTNWTGTGDTGETVSGALISGSRFYVAGQLSPTNNDYIAAFRLSDGALDPTFGSGGRAVNTFGAGGHNGVPARALAVDPSNGDLVITGTDGSPGSALFVARVQSNGSPRSTFGTNGTASAAFTSETPNAVAVQSNGSIIVAGSGTNTRHNANTPFIGRFQSGGAVDTAFGAGGNGAPAGFQWVDGTIGGTDIFTEIGVFQAVTVQASTGKIAATGWYRHTNTDTTAPFPFYAITSVFNSNGTPDSSFTQPAVFPNSSTGGTVISSGPDNYIEPTAVAYDTLGRLVLGASVGDPNAGVGRDFGVARYTSSGALDSTFGEVSFGTVRTGIARADAGGSDAAYAMALQSDGKIVVAGGNNPDYAVARFMGDSTQSPEATDRVVFSSTNTLVGMDINGNHAFPLAFNADFPTISPDSLKLAYQRMTGLPHIFVSNIDGSAPADISAVTDPSNFCDDEQPAWSPDGTKIAFSRSCSGSPRVIYVMNPDGSGATPVTTAGTDQYPSWAPGSDRIAFSRSGGAFATLMTVVVATGAETTLVNTTTNATNPAWGPNNTIVFVTDPGTGEQLHTIDGGGPLNSDSLLVGGVAIGSVAWSPDGSKVVIFGNLQNSTSGVSGAGVWVEPTSPPEQNPLTPTNPVRVATGAGYGIAVAHVAAIRVTSGPSTPASPVSVPTSAIPLQASSPDVQNSGLPQLPTLHTPLPQLPVLHTLLVQLPTLHTPLIQLPTLHTKLIQLPTLHTPLPQLPVLHTGLGIRELGDTTDIGGSSLVAAGLRRIKLSDVPVVKGDDWSTRLAGTALSTKPLQSVTLADVLAIACAEDTSSDPCPTGHIKPDVLPTFGDIDLTTGAFGQFAVLPFMMGDTRLFQIGADANGNDTFGWCAKLEALGYADCGSALGVPGSSLKGRSASLLSLEIAGVNLDAIDGVRTLKMQDVNFRGQVGGFDTNAAYAPLPNVAISSFDLNASSIGSIALASLPNVGAVVDCSQTNCSAAGATLASIPAAAIRPSAVVADLGAAANNLYLSEVALGAFSGNPSDNPYNVSNDKLGVLGYPGPGSSTVSFSASFVPIESVVPQSFTVHLPVGFRYKPGTSVVTTNGSPSNSLGQPTAAVQADGTQILSWPPAPSSVTLSGVKVTFDAYPGLHSGAAPASSLNITGNSSGNPSYTVSASGGAITVTPNLETGDTTASATPINLDTIYFGFLDHRNDVDYYTIPAPAAGSRINVYLTNCNCDADLVLYHPSNSKPHTPLRPVASSTPVQQGLTDQPLGLTTQGEPLVPEALNDMPLANLPVAAASTSRGTNPEDVHAIAWDAPAGGVYTIEVFGFNGATSPDAYDLHVTVTPPDNALPNGNARSFGPTGAVPSVPTVGRDYKTVILTAPTRLRGAYGDSRADAALAKANDLAASNTVDGLVVPVDAWADVRGAFAALDAHPADPELANDVVRTINADVDALLGAHRSAVKSMVILGSDEIIPMSRVPDLTETANEREFAQDLLRLAQSTGGNDALLGASAAGDILSDDAYGAFAPQPFLGTYLYTPNVALGRLVETPEDMVKVITEFLSPQAGDADGTLHPSNKLVTGYDFMTGMANAIRDSLNSQITSGDMSTLINENWTASDLSNRFTAADPVPDIASVNAHYDPTAALPALGSATGNITDLYASSQFDGADLAKRILFEMGCHSGLSITDFLANGSNYNTEDWPQAALHNGVAAMVANTGYGLSLKDVVSFSAQLMVDYANNLTHMTLGQALTQAKQTYLSAGVPNVYDYKIMAEATYYGLPDFQLPHLTPLPTPPPPPATHTDGVTGVQATSISLPAGSFASQSGSNNDHYLRYGSTNTYSVAQNRPVQPRVEVDVTQPNLTAMGSVIEALSSDDSRQNFNPVLARPVIDNSQNEPEAQTSDVIYPATFENVTTYQAQDGTRQNLELIPAQFFSQQAAADNAPTSGLERVFTQLDSTVYYAPAGTPAGAPPVFSDVTAAKGSGQVSFDVAVNDPNPANTVKRVLVLWHPTNTSGVWTATELTQSGSDWTASVPTTADKVEYLVQAVSSSGAVGRTTNKGDLYESVVAPPPGTATAVINGTPTNGWYASGTTVTFNGAPSFSVQVDGVDAGTIFNGGSVPTTGDGRHVVTYSSANGSGTVTVPVDASGPVITASVDPAPNSNGWNRSATTVTFSCADPESGVASCSPPTHIFDSDGAGQTTTATATDRLGNVSHLTTAVSLDTIQPTITASPTDTTTWHNAPVTVTFSCSDNTGGSGIVGNCPPPETVGPNQTADGSVIDAAGNAASVSVGPFRIDTQAPTITPSADPNGWYHGTLTITFHCDDTGGSGVASCPADPQVLSEANPMTTPVTVTDNAGNSTTFPQTTYKFDNIAPTITVSPDPTAWYHSPQTVTFACGDAGGSGLVGTCPSSQTVSPSSPTVTAKTISDAAGNTATIGPFTYKFDTIAPTITGTITPAPNSAGWNNSNATVTFTCADTGGSGVASCPSPVTISTEGAGQVVGGVVTDNAGNAASTFITVNLDKTAPTSSATGLLNKVQLTLGASVKGVAADNLSGVTKVTVTYTKVLVGTTVTFDATLTCSVDRTSCTWSTPGPAVGVYHVTSVATDAAGNVQAAVVTWPLVVSL